MSMFFAESNKIFTLFCIGNIPQLHFQLLRTNGNIQNLCEMKKKAQKRAQRSGHEESVYSKVKNASADGGVTSVMVTCALDLRGHKAEPSAMRRGHSVLCGVHHQAPRRLFSSFGLHVFASYLLLGASEVRYLNVWSKILLLNDIVIHCFFAISALTIAV